jgi:F-type H+-transporting ATPase subunit 8
MPQLIPFYFVNEITFTFVIIAFTICILSKYFLPSYLRLFYARISIISSLDMQ